MEVTLEHTPHMTAARQRIHSSMVDLLAQAGLDYSGGYVNVAGNRVHYLDYGEGEPVLLLHGGGAGGAVWYRQIAALKDSYRVLAPDSPVFGLSSQPSVPTPLRQFAGEYVQGFIEALQLESVRIAGLSLGGFIALAQAVDRSPRIRSMRLNRFRRPRSRPSMGVSPDGPAGLWPRGLGAEKVHAGLVLRHQVSGGLPGAGIRTVQTIRVRNDPT